MPKKKKPINPDKLKGSWEPEVLRGLKALQAEYKYQIEYETEKLKYTIEHTYNPDFPVRLPNGHTILIEAKGYWDAADRAKIRNVKAQNPDADIRMVFQADNKMHKASTLRYSDFCKKHNIPYAVKVIPKEWFQ